MIVHCYSYILYGVIAYQSGHYVSHIKRLNITNGEHATGKNDFDIMFGKVIKSWSILSCIHKNLKKVILIKMFVTY